MILRKSEYALFTSHIIETKCERNDLVFGLKWTAISVVPIPIYGRDVYFIHIMELGFSSMNESFLKNVRKAPEV